MSDNRILMAFTENDAKKRVVMLVGAHAESLADLTAVAPELKNAENLEQYCDAVNYLARGNQFRPIHDPAAYRAWYERKFQAEDPQAPFQEGSPQLRDFGHCEMDEIQPPRRENGAVIFYVEDDFLGIPYRVTAPSPDAPDGEPTYDPLPMSPLPDETPSDASPGADDTPAVSPTPAMGTPDASSAVVDEVPAPSLPHEDEPAASASIAEQASDATYAPTPVHDDAPAIAAPASQESPEEAPASKPAQEDEPSASFSAAEQTPSAPSSTEESPISAPVQQEPSAPPPAVEKTSIASPPIMEEPPVETSAPAAPMKDVPVQDVAAPGISLQPPTISEETPAPAPVPEPPKPDPHKLLKDAIAADDMPAVKKCLLELQVEPVACDQILAFWEEMATPGSLKSDRLENMMELVSLIKSLAVPKKVKDLLWMLQRRLIKYT